LKAGRGSDKAIAVVRLRIALIFLPLVGCGHPATERECNEIVERITVLELSAVDASAETVAKEVSLAKEAMRREAHKRCVGRRITEKAMTCLRQAKSSKQIEEECFR
jgi:hypothetical protein